MLAIRLSRRGAKKKPFYSIIVVDSRQAAQTGKFKERVGILNPVARGNEPEFSLDLARVDYWLSKGAQPSERVKHLIKRARKEQAAQSESAA